MYMYMYYVYKNLNLTNCYKLYNRKSSLYVSNNL